MLTPSNGYSATGHSWANTMRFMMIVKANLDEAIEIAGQIPGERKGTVEIRG